MSACAYCNKKFGFFSRGMEADGERFCDDDCLQRSRLLQFADALPQAVVQEQIRRVHEGPCPVCGGPGPVDVHVSHRVWSAVVLTKWHSRSRLCCRSCAVKHKLGDALFSGLAGWWGFPWGLVVTPVQMGRNLVGLLSPSGEGRPSPELDRAVRLSLASTVAEEMAQGPR